MEILEPFLIYEITLVRPTNTQNLVEIDFEGRRHTVVKCNGFVTFVLPIFFPRFLISPTGRNSRPFACLLAQTTCPVSNTCLFWVWSLQIQFQGVSGPKNIKTSTRFWTWSICSGTRFSIRALEGKVPLNVKKTPQKLDF